MRIIPPSRLARFELLRFRGVMPRIALAFVLIVPLLYGAIYLTANWNPYGRLDHLPVAVVNADRPATVGKQTIEAGRDFTRQLIESRTFGFVETDESTARNGLRDGDYYLAIFVPADFSANLVSGNTADPKRAVVTLERNDANGFVVGTITSAAQNEIARSVDAAAEESYFNAVFANLATIRKGLGEAAAGAGKLDTGLQDAETGAKQLRRGTSGAVTGSAKLATGASSLADGLGTAKTGSSQLASGLRTLKTATTKLSDGADQVANGTQQLDDQVVPVLTDIQQALPRIRSDATRISTALDTAAARATGATASISKDLDQVGDDLEQLGDDFPGLADSPAYQRILRTADDASDRAGQIAAAAARGQQDVDKITAAVEAGGSALATKVSRAKNDLIKLNTGAQAVATGAQQVETGTAKASAGADSLATGIAKASTGADTLATGAAELSGGVKKLDAGAGSLVTGLTTLHTGAGTLQSKLLEGQRRIPQLSSEDQQAAVQVLSSPADVRLQVDNPATFYGRGLAPMFFSIALWVFGISVFLVVRPITGRALAGRASPVRLSLTAWLPVGGIAVLGGLLMVAAVWLYPGLAPVHPFLTLGVIVLAAVCFSAIAHLLRTLLGSAGSSLLLVWLILQLSSAGGIYPAPLLPGFFATIGPLMPMTYLIDALRITISGGALSRLLLDVAVVGGFAAVALALGVLVVRRRQRFSMKDLHPPLETP